MRLYRIIKRKGILGLTLIGLSSCGNTTKCTDTTIENNNVEINHTDTISINIFGIETQRDEYSVSKNLEKAEVIKIDTISLKNGKFQSAIVEFAGIKFGMNNGFIFITSQQDKKAISSLINEISKYYGEPDIDGDITEPEWCSYHWNLYDNSSGSTYIRIRPLRSEEGGLTMTWQL